LLAYQDLNKKLPTIANWLSEEPAYVTPILDNCTYEAVSEGLDYSYREVFVEVTGLPV